MKELLQKFDPKSLVVFFILGIFLFPGCKKGDWYDVKSDKSLAVPTTLKDMQAILDNAQVLNTFTPALKEAASDGHYVSDAIALALTGPYRNAYTWSHEQPYVKVIDWINGTVSGSYRRVYYANLILDNVDNVKPNDSAMQEEFNSIKGQALFHRGVTFYDLALVFAPPYDEGSSKDKLGIPLRLESDVNIPTKRSSLKATYDQIINDLMLAKDLLPMAPLYRTRPSKQAVFALLARIYLSIEDYDKALVYADLALQSFSTLLDYKTFNSAATTNPFIDYNAEIIFYSNMGPLTPSSFANNLIDQSLYNSYNDNDLRKKLFFTRNASTGIVTYKGTYSGRGFNICFSGLATDEIYLIRAECYARKGNVTLAMKDLNTLLRMRWAPGYTDMIVSNEEEALKAVLNERKKELVLRGLRWSDLRRLNKDPRFAITLTRKVGDKTYTLEPNSYKYTFPIPDDIIQITGIEQNPGWQ